MSHRYLGVSKCIFAPFLWVRYKKECLYIHPPWNIRLAHSPTDAQNFNSICRGAKSPPLLPSAGVHAEQRQVEKNDIQDADEKQSLGCDAIHNSADSAEVVCAGVDDVYPAEVDNLVSAGLDDLYPMETDSIVSAGLDDDLSVVLSLAPIEAYQDGEWVLYFSSTHSCLVPAKILGSGFFLTDDPGTSVAHLVGPAVPYPELMSHAATSHEPGFAAVPGELPLYRCRVGTGQMREHVPLRALRTTLEAGGVLGIEKLATGVWRCGIERQCAEKFHHVLFVHGMWEIGVGRLPSFVSLLVELKLGFACAPEGDNVDMYSAKHKAWKPAMVLKSPPLQRAPHRAMFQVPEIVEN